MLKHIDWLIDLFCGVVQEHIWRIPSHCNTATWQTDQSGIVLTVSQSFCKGFTSRNIVIFSYTVLIYFQPHPRLLYRIYCCNVLWIYWSFSQQSPKY